MNEPGDTGWLAALGTALGALVGGVLWMRRKLSTDATGNREDRARRDIISTLEHERDAARSEAERERVQRTDDARTIARLAAEVEHLQRDIERLAGENRKLKRMLPADVRGAVDTNFAPLGGPEV